MTDGPAAGGHSRTVALLRTVAGNLDIWLLDTVRDTLRRFTTDPANDQSLAWSPDGTRLALTSTRLAGVLDLYERSVAGDATETLLLASAEPKNAMDWSPDGRFILYIQCKREDGERYLGAAPLRRSKTPARSAHSVRGVSGALLA